MAISTTIVQPVRLRPAEQCTHAARPEVTLARICRSAAPSADRRAAVGHVASEVRVRRRSGRSRR